MIRIIIASCAFLAVQSMSVADDHYVATNGNHTSPFTNWFTAATDIQSAVNAAVPGETVWVSNGVYYSSGPDANSAMVSVLTNISVKSMNGATKTIVDGNLPTFTNTCFYLIHENAIVDGFTITNGGGSLVMDGSTPYGGGVCSMKGQILNCTVVGNTARFGGGLFLDKMNGSSVVSNCVIRGNTATASGGGIYMRYGYNMIVNCLIVSNTAAGTSGGGVFTRYDNSTIRNCVISHNATLGTVASGGGGAIMYCGMLQNCTIVSNSAAACNGGGIHFMGPVTVENSIVYFNNALVGANYTNGAGHAGAFTNSCTLPDPGGVGNIAANPKFVDFAAGNFRLLLDSPCINAGKNRDWMIGAPDFDGGARILYGTVDMGAYEKIYEGTFISLR